ncbi:MAG: protein kinase [Verrucomicrobiota bacterium]
MNTARTCEQCSTPLPPDAPRGICPQCLLNMGLEDTVSGPPTGALDESLSGKIKASQEGPAIGTTVRYFGDYELIEKIAQGGMGIVYKARQAKLNRVVAVKMILSGQLASEADIQRFLTEAEAAANLQHPNIVAIHEIGEHEGQHYFSMDYVEGKNLAEFVQENPISSPRAAQILKMIAEAIHYAHQRGTLHRDLKPQNVLIDADGQPRITDFGLAKRTERESGLTVSGAVLGSPGYMPPEQAVGRHEEVGPQSDVYSLGAILYYLLTGRPPFRGETPLATLQQVVEAEPIAPSKLNSNVPPDLETICLKCLEKQPEHRYHSARALAEELGRFLEGEPILARPASRLRRAWTWSRRNPWAITGAATLIVLAMACCAYYFLQQSRYLQWIQNNPNAIQRRVAQPVLITFVWCSFVLFSAVHFVGKGFHRQLQVWKLGGKPVTRGLLFAYGFLGASMIVYGLVVLFKTIELSVWLADEASYSIWVFAIVQAALAVLIWRGVYVVSQTVVLHERALTGKVIDSQQNTVTGTQSKGSPLVIAGWRILFWSVTGLFAVAAIMNVCFALVVGFRDSDFPMGQAPFLWLWAATPVALLLARNPAWAAFRRNLVRIWLIALIVSAAIFCFMQMPQSREQWGLVLLGPLIWNLPAAGLLVLAARVRERALGSTRKESSMESNVEHRNFISVLARLSMQWTLWVWLVVMGAITVLTAATWKSKLAADRSWDEFVAERQNPGAGSRPPDEINFAKTPLIEALAYQDRMRQSEWEPIKKAGGILHLGDFTNGLTNNLAALAADLHHRGLNTSTAASPAEQVLHSLQEIEPQLTELREASRRAYAIPDRPVWKGARQLNQLNVNALVRLTRILVAHGSASLQAGRIEEAFADWRVIAKIGKLAESDVWSSSWIQMRGLQLFWEGQQRHQWNAAQLSAFAQDFEAVDLLRQMDNHLIGEAEMQHRFMNPADLAMQLCIQPWVFRDEMKCNHLYRELGRGMYDLRRKRVAPEQVRSACERLAANWAKQHWMVRYYFGEPEDVAAGFLRLAKRQTLFDQATVVCALERFRLDRGHYPERLDELATLSPKLPQDVITGNPMQYRRMTNGIFLLYSAGWDQIDNGGTPALTKYRKELTGDWVWPMVSPSL